MDYTEGTEEFKRERSKIQMLWFGIISLFMTFGGLTSAYIVSRERSDWDASYEFPIALIISTCLIVISSITIHLAKRSILRGDKTMGVVLMTLTLLLGIGFVICQFQGFQHLMDQGYYFTGESSTITSTFIFLIAVLHIVHVSVGLLALLFLITGAYREKYTPDSHLGLTLGVTFWHFVDVLWVFLFVLFYIWR